MSALKTNIDSSEGMEDDTPSKWQPNESGCSHTHSRQNRFPAKRGNKRQTWTLYNDKGDNTNMQLTNDHQNI